MERILIVSSTGRSTEMLLQTVGAVLRPSFTASAGSGGEARRMLLGDDFDLIVINAPLPDEFGHLLALHAAESTAAGVLLLVKEELLEQTLPKVEEGGVFVLSKPLSRPLVYQTLHLLEASGTRLRALEEENRKLTQRLEDARIIGRAKCVLIELRGMSEPEAHTYIEKQAMNRRLSARKMAQNIIASPWE